ncbi:MAG: hypothetical protein H6Q71_2906 [Firmicutes bacterium]|nr:hypothetical protein [Bacillota bacterium]
MQSENIEEKKKAATAGTSDRTIMKPFLIGGGWFIVEMIITNSDKVAFSVRGVVEPEKLSDVLQQATEFIQERINDNKH